jgi:cytochrome c oxidase subunit IV
VSTETLPHDAAAHAESRLDDHDAHHPSDLRYVGIFAVLVLITAVEVYLSYADYLGRAFLPLLLILMAVKFVMVVSWFMHLKFDNKLFSVIFYSGLVLAIAVYIAALTTSQFWTK